LIELPIKRGVPKMKHDDKSFRDEAVRLALTSPQPYSKTAHDLGIKPATLYHWIRMRKDQAPIISDESGNQTNLVEELNRLRKENARLKEEREILKKATAFFAKEVK
jgi:transposase